MRRDTASAFVPITEQELVEAQNNLNRGLPQGGAKLTAKVLGGCIALNGTQGAAYLAGRGIPSDSLSIIDCHGDLLFHPSLWHKETEQTFPALICRLRDEAGEIACVQRIYLQKGQPQRLMHWAAKKNTTTPVGAALRLGKLDADHVLLGEGPETILSAAIADPSALSLACCGPLRSEVVPASVLSTTILIDRGAEEKAQVVAAELRARGIKPRLAHVPDDLPDPDGGKADVNTLLQAYGRDAVRAMLDAAKPPADPVEQALDRLATLSSMEYDRVRASEAERLGVRVGTLDSEVKKRRPVDTAQTTRQGQPLVLNDPKPWPDPVNGAALLNDLVATFERYLALPQHAAHALALWVLHTFCLSIATSNPRLAIISPQKRCGKTTLVSVLSKLVPRPLPAANITPAAVYRAIEACTPTLLLDEADTFLADNHELRGVLNSGHTRATAFVIRSVGDEHQPRRFATWCPMAIAAIGRLSETLMDRSIVIEMRRRRANEKVKRLRIDRTPDLNELAAKAARWTADNLEGMTNADPDVPAALNDRAADNWRPLLAIADAAGGEWSTTARQAALALAGEQEDDSIDVLLLQDIRAIFDDRGSDRLPSNDLADALVALQGRPWSDWKRGKPLTANALSRLLKPFSIVPGSIRVGAGSKDTPKGYKREQFADAWSRYASAPADKAIQTATTPHPSKSEVLSENRTATNDSMWRFENGKTVNESEACGVVADWSVEECEHEDAGSEAGCMRSGEPSKKIPETHQPIEPSPMPKCSICGSSIPISQNALLTDSGGLAHRSCTELRIPSRRR